MRKEYLEENGSKVFRGDVNKNVSFFQDDYSVFHKDILKRHIFKIPSKTMIELYDRWSGEQLETQSDITLPTYILSKKYKKIFFMEVEQENLYYLRLHTIGTPFQLQLNGESIFWGDGKQLDYEIPVTSFLKQGENNISIQFDTIEKGVFIGVKILKRPKNHILGYKILKQINEDQIFIEIQPTYIGGFIPSQCLLLTETGKKIKKVKVVEEGKIILDIPRKEIEVWNDETHRLYSLVFIMEEEVIAQKIAIRQEGFEGNCYVVDGKPVDLRIIHFGKAVSNRTYMLKEELINHMSLWKKRNFNALYVDDSMDSPYLQKLCLELGFYYIREQQALSMKEEKELFITSDGVIREMPEVYLPLSAWEVKNRDGMISIKNEMKFQNLKENYYVRIATYQNGKQVGQNIKYILDFEAGVFENFRPEWASQLEGDITVKIECYQRYKTELVEKRHFYGAYELLIQK